MEPLSPPAPTDLDALITSIGDDLQRNRSKLRWWVAAAVIEAGMLAFANLAGFTWWMRTLAAFAFGTSAATAYALLRHQRELTELLRQCRLVEPDGRYRDRQGRPISIEEWARLFEDDAYCKVASDDLGGAGRWTSIEVRTVWQGFDGNVLGTGADMDRFGSIILLRSEDATEYAAEVFFPDEKSAIAGHQARVERMRAGLALKLPIEMILDNEEAA